MTMAGVRRLSIGACVLITSALAAQQLPVRDNTTSQSLTGTAVLSGTVVNDVTNRPARRAVLSLSSSDSGLRLSAITDDTGTFAFRDLPEGRYYLGASKAGYVTTSYGARRTNRPGTTIALTAGQRRTEVMLRLVPGAVLTGTVRNRSGEPVPGVRVIALRQTVAYDTGERTLQQAAGGLGEVTDDRGTYRVYGLPPDDYFLVVAPSLSRNANELREITAAEVDWARRQLQTPGGVVPAGLTAAAQIPAPGRAVDYSPVFYPGAFSQAHAGTISLKPGEERSGVDILLDLTPTAKITGTVVSPSGGLPENLQVNVIAHDTIPGVPFSGFGTARVDKTGAFSSAGLPPGDYTVTVRVGGAGARGAGGGSPASSLFGAATVGVNGSDVDVRVALQPGVTLSGQLFFDGTTLKPPADLSRIQVNLTAVRGKTPTLGVPAATADASGAFRFVGVTPGRYRLAVYSGGGWQMKSAIVDGRDTLDTALEIRSDDVGGVEIRFTDLQTEISGQLLDAAGGPAPEYFIILFPADKTFWTPLSRRIQSTRPASDGRYRVQNLPPGEYLIAAVTDVEQGEWYDPSFLAQLVGSATRITLAEGEKKTQSLKIGR